MVDVKNLVAAIRPEYYCDDSYKNGSRINKTVQKIVSDEYKKMREEAKKKKEKGLNVNVADYSPKIYLEAAKKAVLKKCDYIDVMNIKFSKGPFTTQGLKVPIEQHFLEYDASMQGLEPLYFSILDLVNNEYSGGADKLIDNFVSSPGSGHFSEMSRRATVLHDEAMKTFGTVNTVIRSILNIIYDMKEFKMRLQHYDDLKSSNPNLKKAAVLALKQIWLDSVDTKRGNTSIKAMALSQFDFVTLLDAFMAAEDLDSLFKEPDKGGLDLNERVRRILQQRYADFERWVIESERELRKRFEIEKIYLKSQVNSIKLYARWIKPQLEAAQKLEQRMEPTNELINQFNTTMFELALLAKNKYNPAGDIARGDLPRYFEKLKLRTYYSLNLIEFKYRTIPERSDQRGGYNYIGRAGIRFTSFSLNDDEIKLLKELIDMDDFGSVYKMIMGATDESLQQLNDDLIDLLGEGADGKTEKKEKKNSKDDNPFSALFSFLGNGENDKDLPSQIKSDNEYEKVLRSQAILNGHFTCRKVYNLLKKSLNMAGFPPVQF